MRSPERAGLHEFLALFAIASVGISQPCFDVLGRHAEFFVAHRAGPFELWLVAALIGLALPAIVASIVPLSALLGPRARALGFAAGCIGAAGIATLPLQKRWLEPGPWLAGCLAAAAGVLLWRAYRHFAGLRSLLSLLAGAAPVFAGLFLWATPVRQLREAPEPVAPSSAEIDADTPIVIVLFDELPLVSLLDSGPERAVDAALFPNFARLAEQSTWFANASTVSNATAYAIPALVTGRYPDRRRLPIAADYPETLFHWLAEDYALHVSESFTRLCDAPECRDSQGAGADLAVLFEDVAIVGLHVFLPTALTESLPPVGTQWARFGDSADRVSAGWRSLVVETLNQDRETEFEAFLADMADHPDATLHYLHLNLPHGPFLKLPSGLAYVPDSGPLRRRRFLLGRRDTSLGPQWLGSTALVELAYQRHLLQAVYADRLLGRLLARLEELRKFDAAALFVLADHGVSFRPNRLMRDKRDGGTVLVPLFVKAPGQQTAVVDRRNAETIDVLPTLADLLEAPLPWSVDGTSLLGPAPARPVKRIVQPDEGVVELAWPGDYLSQPLAEKEALFGRDPDVARIFAVGPLSELHGRLVTEFPVVPGRGRAEVDQAQWLRAVDPESGTVPAYLTGAIVEAGAETQATLVIAVNGVIGSSVRTHRSADGLRFAALVPPSLLQPGANRVDVYRVRGAGTRLRLEIVTNESPPAP
ncbi:MAG: sulfatase-like hydrolase/transferase [Proteobacteria bacterium]|nr:sulfatase-like hydrolase/transferase [Pseudomonadota bacterium]